MIYFVEGNSVGSDFGFPRVDTKKHYRWKKMNFTTDLPKKRPYVTYIVASAVKCERFFPNSRDEGPLYRMHAVILNKDRVHTQKYKSRTLSSSNQESDEQSQALSSTCSSTESTEHENLNLEGISDVKKQKDEKNYILCHVRKIDSNYNRTSRVGGKKSVKEEEEIEDEDEDDKEENISKRAPTKKVFCSSKSVFPVQQPKQSSPKVIGINTSPIIKEAHILTIDLYNQDKKKSEVSSPIEKEKSQPSSCPSKSSLIGLSTRKSAFNSFQSFVTLKKPIVDVKASVGVKIEEEKPHKIVISTASNKSGSPETLFKGFNFHQVTNRDYFQLFTSLISVNKK